MRIQQKVATTVLVAVCLMLLVPMICHIFPFLAGADSSYELKGGSMFPALKEGDVILNRKVDASTINVGDILTVNPEGSVYTHRVVEKLEDVILRFKLKGDANEDPDPNYIRESQIIGKVVLVFPFSFLDTPIGLALTLWVPAVLIVSKQIHLIIKRRKGEASQTVDMSTFLLAIILVFSITRLMSPYLGSRTYFSDSESASGTFHNVFHKCFSIYLP